MKIAVLRILTAIAVGAAAFSASAVTIVSPGTYGLYSVDPGTPNNPGDRLTYLNNAITLWNANTASAVIAGDTYSRLSGTVPTGAGVLPAFAGVSDDQNWSSTSFDLGTTPVLYLYVHFGGYSIAYYLGGLTGEITIDNGNLPLGGGGVSTVSRYFSTSPDGGDTVPDGGLTLALLGLGLTAVGACRKFIRC
jgi:hypothetical protein